MHDLLGRWEPMSASEVAALLRDAPFSWWFTGGVALELFTGTSWRTHDDIDVGIRRSDAPAVHGFLASRLSPFIAAAGSLSAWGGEGLDETRSQNNIWLRRGDGPWVLDIVVGEGDDHEWVYRRDTSLRRPWGDAVLRSERGPSYLAPELQLLFKSKNPRPKDDADLVAVLPHLDQSRRSALADLLPDGHPWQSVVNTST
jgi:hypothetical protein